MNNRYREDFLLDVEDQEGDETTCAAKEPDEIDEIIEETKKEIHAIFEAEAKSK